MAFSQDADSKKGIAEVNPANADGLSYIAVGGIWFVFGQGTPTSGASSELKDAPKGSCFFSSDQAKVYVKSSAGDGSTNTTWTDLTATS
tara:strand:- start:108 stop:374 length:267 start_codon:yes stop_codon:yes gene_type:complete